MHDDVAVIPIDDRVRWLAETEGNGLPSQAWSYSWGLSASGIIPKLAIVHCQGARMVLPFFERHWDGTKDISTIVGPSGAWFDRSSVAPLLLWQEFAATQAWVAGYIQLSSSVELTGLSDKELVVGNTDFILDLENGDIFGSVSETLRRKIRNAQQMGAVLVDDRLVLARRLQQLYPATMRRLNAEAPFQLSAETINRWVEHDQSMILGARIDGSIEAVMLFYISGSQAEANITATTERARHLSTWLIWQASSRMRAIGVKALNLGGCVRPGDGVYDWKSRFHCTQKSRQSVRQIYDPTTYAELCVRARVPMSGGRFPAYRSSRPS
jgi:Acetyltransferase (GNAT) domain